MTKHVECNLRRKNNIIAITVSTQDAFMPKCSGTKSRQGSAGSTLCAPTEVVRYYISSFSLVIDNSIGDDKLVSCLLLLHERY